MNTTVPTIERRRHPRTQVNMQISCVRLDPDGGDVMDRLHVTNISRGGMGAMSDRSYYPGQRIVLNLPLSKEGGHRSIYASVIRCRQRSDGYQIGFEFDPAALNAWIGDKAVETIAA